MGIDKVDDVGELSKFLLLELLSNISSSSVFVKSDRYLVSSAISLAFDSDSIQNYTYINSWKSKYYRNYFFG